MCATFLYVYFNYAYFLLISPYRLKKLKDGSFTTVDYLPQKILCATSNVLGLLIYIYNLQIAVNKTTVENPTSIVSFLEVLCSNLYKISLLVSFWRKRRIIKQIVNLLAHDPYLKGLQSISKFQSCAFITFLVGVGTCINALKLIYPAGAIYINVLLNSTDNMHSKSSWYEDIRREIDHTFGLQSHLIYDSSPGNITNFPESVGVSFLVWGLIYALICKIVLGFYSDVAILMHILTLLIPVRQFIKNLKIQNCTEKDAKKLTYEGKLEQWRMVASGSGMRTVMEQYNSLKILASELTESIGWVLLFYLGETIPTYGLHFQTSVFADDKGWKAVICLFYVVAILIFVCSSEICRQMGFFKDWLYENRKDLSLNCNETALILDSITRGSVSVSACDIFTITYSMIGTILGVLITFLIMSVQSPLI